MSIESAKEFLERVKNDEDFKKEVAEIATAEKRMEFVKTQGFDFKKEELDTITSELDDDELDFVSGGIFDSECRIKIRK